jgi:ribosomal protein L21E
MNPKNTLEDFGVGDHVNVESHPDDIFHDFTGTVVEVNNEYIIVEDQDGDRWDCEPQQLSHNSDEHVH